MKYLAGLGVALVPGSSSTRRTWIEITGVTATLGKEAGRPPHGGRGLKCKTDNFGHVLLDVVLHTEDVD